MINLESTLNSVDIDPQVLTMYLCGKCNYEFYTPSDLLRHLRIISMGRPTGPDGRPGRAAGRAYTAGAANKGES
jgi:hypothetical protein